MHDEQSTKGMEEALYALAEALDPDHQGEQWPDPLAWDGRPYAEQAADLLALADSQSDDYDYAAGRLDTIRRAATCVRELLEPC